MEELKYNILWLDDYFGQLPENAEGYIKKALKTFNRDVDDAIEYGFKVKGVDTFEAFIRPWDGGSATRKDAAKKAGVPLKTIESAEDVDLVMPKFFEFVGDNILVSTEALGNQAKIITRAVRYAGMNEIKNEFYDLLDLAADISEDFDMENNTRSYLCSYFGINAGRSAREKALANKEIYDALINCGEENE